MNLYQPNATEPIVTRSIRTPDGVWHIVPLQASYWDWQDWLIEQGSESLERMIDFNWRYVQKFPGQDFGAAFENYIHVRMMQYLAKRFNLANDNYYDEHHVWEKEEPSYRIKLAKIPS